MWRIPRHQVPNFSPLEIQYADFFRLQRRI